MSNREINVTLLLRNDPALMWISKDPVLGKGEIGIETDTRKFKIGDGISAWTALKYASGANIEIRTTSPTAADVEYEIGTDWINTNLEKAYRLFSKTSNSARWVEMTTVNGNIASANKLSTARTITLKGDVVETSKEFDGTENISFSIVLQNSVSAGTYTKLTVNNKGIVTSASTLSASDIPSLTLAKISDAGTAASRDIGDGAGNVVVLDQNAKLPVSTIPAYAVTDVFVVASEQAMLALDAQTGDFAIRTDISSTFILAVNTPTVLSAWKELRVPEDKVLSINGKTGTVTLTTSDIAEGTRLYFTTARATANFNTNFATKSVTDLVGGDKVLLETDTFVLNGGNA